MSRNYYSEINLHIAWHTKASSPLLIPKVEVEAHHALRAKCVNASGVYIHAVGGIGTHGRPSPLVDLRVVDGDDNELLPGETGEIAVRGLTVMCGYWNRFELSAFDGCHHRASDVALDHGTLALADDPARLTR